jgi:lysophospholipase L1-like esterase
MRRPRPWLVLALVLVPAPVARAEEEPPALPGSVASIGDSISRGTNAYGWYGDHPSFSWSTGFNPVDGFASHYERLFRADHTLWGDELNVARSGAAMADAPGQAQAAVAAGADYVTFLMGANDLCRGSAAQMTSVAEFRADLERSLSILDGGGARVLVASIPNVIRLGEVYGDDPLARFVWRQAELCPSVLDPENTWRERLAVWVRELEFNLALRDTCARYANCRFDDFAVYSYAFDRDDVSRLDYFHPSIDGQRTLAELTWPSAWWSG